MSLRWSQERPKAPKSAPEASTRLREVFTGSLALLIVLILLLVLFLVLLLSLLLILLLLSSSSSSSSSSSFWLVEGG